MLAARSRSRPKRRCASSATTCGTRPRASAKSARRNSRTALRYVFPFSSSHFFRAASSVISRGVGAGAAGRLGHAHHLRAILFAIAIERRAQVSALRLESLQRLVRRLGLILVYYPLGWERVVGIASRGQASK